MLITLPAILIDCESTLSNNALRSTLLPSEILNVLVPEFQLKFCVEPASAVTLPASNLLLVAFQISA